MIALLALAIVVQTPASLTDAFGDVSRAFAKRHPDVRVHLNTGGSAALALQVERGAPADVMASADPETMDTLELHGKIDPATRTVFARNALVLVVPRSGPAKLHWADLASHPAISRIAVGDENVPAGRYARQVLTRLGLWDAVRPKLVPCADVRQALAYASLGEVDAAAIYATDAVAGKARVRVTAEAPPGSHAPIVLPIAVVKTTRNADLARRWIELVLSDSGQAILARHGFRPGRRP